MRHRAHLVVCVTYRDQPTTYAGRIDASGAPTGPLTGERCDTPDQWALEVVWRFEEIETEWVEQALRTERGAGVVELTWR